ncbi:hypothetical protein TUM3794_20160 [Shewanella colwelliana]|uniref:Uncharacterized protein n=1 Tax=Shewanella colwelliana TaxID=23 RepID=A0ABQ4P0E7_SHECO|nr:hypothetical protein [Shewanella colwelliana]GIU40957.1 hypothetical protein TUM3794_20160 [Shewanella colwelliana]
MKKVILLSLATFCFTGCATDPVEQFNAQQEQKRDEAVALANAELDNVPEWYLSPPQNDAFGIVGVGSAKSRDLAVAVKKAKLQAEFELAKNYRQELSGSERIYEREDATGNLVQTSQFLIDKLIDSVPVVGYEQLDQKVMVLPTGQFQAYSLLKLPYDEFNKVLQSIKAQSQDAQELAAFNDLERRLESKRKREEQEKSDDHQRKLELMDQQQRVLTGGAKAAKVEGESEAQSESNSDRIAKFAEAFQ